MLYLLKLRKKRNKKRPAFLRSESQKLKRFKNNPKWRKPSGKRNKMRTKEASKPDMPDIGWRGPASVRGLHPSGLPEVLVSNVSQIEGLKGDVIVKVASGVGQKKKLDIVKAAQEKGIRIANPALRIRLRSAEEIEEVLPVKAFAKFSFSPKASEEERRKIEEAAEEKGIKLWRRSYEYSCSETHSF